jgi:hypothetical protein
MRKTKPLPTVETLCEIVSADLGAGKLFWRANGKEVRPSSRFYGGVRVRLGGEEYLLHRVLYKIAHGDEPPVIDHVDGNRSNNSDANLRAATDSVNMRNKASYRNNAAGHANIQARHGKWRVRFKVAGRTLHLGVFATLADAICARDEAKAGLGFHPNHGRG